MSETGRFDRFFQYSMDHNRPVRMLTLDNDKMRYINATVLELTENEISIRRPGRKTPDILPLDTILSVSYARGDDGDTLKDMYKSIYRRNMAMTKTVEIQGMMCMHCAARVKKALENLPEVAKAEVSFENGTAVLTLDRDVAEETVKKTVTDAGYTFVKLS